MSSFQALILLYTGRSKYYSSNATRYYGFKTPEDAEKRNPLGIIQPGLMSFNVNLKSNTMSLINLSLGLDSEAAEWLLENRNVLGYGIDAITLDSGDSG